MQPKFQQKQWEFTAYIRDPEHQPLPRGVQPERMRVYKELIYNNLNRTLKTGFPVLNQVLSEHKWHLLVREYLIQYRSPQPYFHQIPETFVTFLQERGLNQDEPGFLLELTHYEWVELALSIAEDPPESIWQAKQGDFLKNRILISPLAWAFQYQYPVHQISPQFQPESAPEQPTYLVIYRDQNNQVNFMEINAVTARLIDYIKQQPQLTGQVILEDIAEECRHPKPQQVIDGGKDILQQLLEQGIVLGIDK